MATEPYAHLALTRSDHVLWIAMSNPPLHTMVPTEVVELNRVMDDVEADPDLRVLVLTGASEEYFVRSYDVGQLAEASANRRARERTAPANTENPAAHSFQGLMRRLENWRGITIAAINGHAAGGGFELALACDFRVMRDGEFTVSLPETTVGIIPGAGGTQRLPRLIGFGQALDYIIHGRRFAPAEALAAGMIHRVFSAENFHRDVHEFAIGIANRAPLAIQAAKQAVREGLGLSLDEGIEREAALFRQLMATEDAAQALKQVAAGKPPGAFTRR